jgi:hypothetical protein
MPMRDMGQHTRVLPSCEQRDMAAMGGVFANLLHNSCLALRESDMPTRLVRDEFDFNLSSLATRLIIVVVIVIGSRRALALDAATVIGSGN